MDRPQRDHRHGTCATWIADLKSAGLHYEITILEAVDAPKAPSMRCWWWTGANVTSLNDAERWWIAFGRASGWPLTNATDGGEGMSGYIHKETSRARMSVAWTPERHVKHAAKF